MFKLTFPNTVSQAIGVIVVNSCINTEDVEQDYEPVNIEPDQEYTAIEILIKETERMFTNLQIRPENIKILYD